MAIWHRTPPLAQKQAALGEMASGIVHDFRNILAVIGSAVRMAEMSSDEPERARIYLAGAQEGIDRGLKLTSELLTVAAPCGPSEVEEVGIELYDVNLLLKKTRTVVEIWHWPWSPCRTGACARHSELCRRSIKVRESDCQPGCKRARRYGGNRRNSD